MDTHEGCSYTEVMFRYCRNEMANLTNERYGDRTEIVLDITLP